MASKNNKLTKALSSKGLPAFLAWNSLIFGVIILFVLASKIISSFEVSFCAMKVLFGIFCPFCGGTRCVMNFIQFNFRESFMYHPITFIFIIYSIIVEFVYLIDIIVKSDRFSKIFKIDTVAILYLSLCIIQYAFRLYCFYSHVDCQFMYVYV